MGVDKDDIRKVIHFEMAPSLEQYIQEAGRAGRNPQINAECTVLYRKEDQDKHFNLLLAMRLTRQEINQIWRGIKSFGQPVILRSALEIAKRAGWREDLRDLETKVKTAINALESAGFLKRETNAPRIFADSILPRSFQNARTILDQNADRFNKESREFANRVVHYLYEKDDLRVDYMAEKLGIYKKELITILTDLRQIGILGDEKDLSATIQISGKHNGRKVLTQYRELENYLLNQLHPGIKGQKGNVNLRTLNTRLLKENMDQGIKNLKNILQTWQLSGWLDKERLDFNEWIYIIKFKWTKAEIDHAIKVRNTITGPILEYLKGKIKAGVDLQNDETPPLVKFSVVELNRNLEEKQKLELNLEQKTKPEYRLRIIEQALLYMHHIGALDLREGLLVYYNRMKIKRLEQNNRKKYNLDHYRQFEHHYRTKTEQIHIATEYAERLGKWPPSANLLMEDYFELPYRTFLERHFPGKRNWMQQAMRPEKYKEIFGVLSNEQKKVMEDHHAQNILILAGPGSGKTTTLVHKMASLILREDVKPDQLLMLTFSRPAAQEFKKRLRNLVSGLSYYLDIFTYHSYAFRLLGRQGSLEEAVDIIPRATAAISKKEIPLEAIANKNVIILDEYQDPVTEEAEFLKEIWKAAGGPRIIAAGDDDQAIFSFREKFPQGDPVRYMKKLAVQKETKVYYLTTNYRAAPNLVSYCNSWLKEFPPGRLKADRTLIAYKKQAGEINHFHYQQGTLILPLVKYIIQQKQKGSIAVLTQTNEQARLIYTQLRHANLNVRLLESTPDYRLRDLYEIYSFSQSLHQEHDKRSGFISREVWENAKTKLEKDHSISKAFPLVKQILTVYEQESKYKYWESWQAYLSQLRIEDLFTPEKLEIQVSTMHKSKGKEYDHVHILHENFPPATPDEIRVWYVAITRAKSTLTLHTKTPGNTYPSYRNVLPGYQLKIKHGSTNQLKKILLITSPKDIYLDRYKTSNFQKNIQKLKAGYQINFHQSIPLDQVYDPKALLLPGRDRSSQGNNNIIKAQSLLIPSARLKQILISYSQKGYKLKNITIQYLLSWQPLKTKENFIIPLFELELLINPG